MAQNKIKSFQNVLESLVNVCRAHPLVHQAEHGDPWEMSTGGNVVYPLCMVVPTSINALDKEAQYNFNIICMDLVEPSESNETRVLSATSRILLDIVAFFKRGDKAFAGTPRNPYKNTNPFYDYTNEISTTFTLEPFSEKFTDNVAGWNMQFSITMQFDYSVCDWDIINLDIQTISTTNSNNTANTGTAPMPVKE